MFEKRQLVVPGDLLAEGDFLAGENTYREGERVYSQKLGLTDLEGKRVFVVPLKDRYMPRVQDLVIGQVVDISLSGWELDINSPYNANLGVSEVTGKTFTPKTEMLTKIMDVGEIVVAEVVAFDRTRGPAITIRGPGLGKVEGGVIVEINTAKVPRLIGKKGSMIGMIMTETGCEMVVGKNGKILIQGRNPERIDLAIRAIRMIEEQAHTTGLTDRVKEFLESEKKGGKLVK